MKIFLARLSLVLAHFVTAWAGSVTISSLSALAEEPLKLEEAREQGRLKSRYLQAAKPNEKVPPATESAAVPQANVAFFHEFVGPTLRKSCLACHGPEKSEGRLRIDQLNPDLITGPDVDRWREVFNALGKSEMPPADEPTYALADADRGRIVDWLSDELNNASLVRRNQQEHSSFRRLTNYEYSHALQDLLGLQHPVPNKLPPETSPRSGFKNSSDLLQMSAMQFETYREVGWKALRRATVVGERPAAVTYIINMQAEMDKALARKKEPAAAPAKNNSRKPKNQQQLWDRETGETVAFPGGKTPHRDEVAPAAPPPAGDVALVLPRSQELKLDLDRFLPDDGTMRVRIRASRSSMNPNEHASLRLTFSAHTSNNANFAQVITERDVPVTAASDQPQVIDIYISLSDIQRNPFRKLATTFPRRDEFLHIQNISNAGGPEPLTLLIDYVEISAPYFDQWPPTSHTNIFPPSDNKANEDVYAREVLNRFLRRAWRRPVATAEVDQFMQLFAKYRPSFTTTEEALIEVLATALASPDFLYLTQRSQNETDRNTNDEAADPQGATKRKKSRISDWEFASRLALFLWSSIPDEELLTLAEQGTLRNPDVLATQLKRLLADPRAKRFARHFVEQWLALDGLNSVTHISDPALREALHEEPIAYFEEVLSGNQSIVDFLHSDYVVVNERLAGHYQIPQVYGPQFRKVPVTAAMHRGGLLTCGAVLTMNSDGKDSHPLKRGVWMLERILNDPPPPPPPNVPQVDLTDPEILKMTLKERIVNHRDKPACLSCHSRIDPWGIAFENYDALGLFRTQVKNQPVDATAELYNRQKLDGIEGLKRHLLIDRQDQFARAMVHKLTSYALGRPLTFADRVDMDRLTTEVRRHQDGLQDLIRELVSSDIFNSQ
ncbi:MAG: DUF1592 domain-containing protein [Planctomycetota bacterium]